MSNGKSQKAIKDFYQVCRNSNIILISNKTGVKLALNKFEIG